MIEHLKPLIDVTLPPRLNGWCQHESVKKQASFGASRWRREYYSALTSPFYGWNEKFTIHKFSCEMVQMNDSLRLIFSIASLESHRLLFNTSSHRQADPLEVVVDLGWMVHSPTNTTKPWPRQLDYHSFADKDCHVTGKWLRRMVTMIVVEHAFLG